MRIDGLAEAVAARVVRINPSAVTGTRSVMADLTPESTPGLRQRRSGHAQPAVKVGA